MTGTTLISQVCDRILTSGTITPIDQAQLLQVAKGLDHPLSYEEQGQIKQLVDRFHMGLLRVANEPSNRSERACQALY
jgi:hypothetical protein